MVNMAIGIVLETVDQDMPDLSVSILIVVVAVGFVGSKAPVLSNGEM